VISLRHDDAARFAIAAAALVVLVGAVAVLEAQGRGVRRRERGGRAAQQQHGLPAGASAGE